MANDITKNPIYIEAATIGVITTEPLWIKKLLLVPNAAADAATLKYWIEKPGAERVHKKSVTATGTDSNTITSTGNFVVTTMAVVTDAIHVYESSTGNNIGTWEISSRADNAIDVLPATLTTESDKVYSWKVYESYPLATMKSQATNLLNYELDFSPRGLYVPNLMITAMSTSSVLYIYL